MHAPIRYSLFLIATPFLLAQSAQISGIIMDASKSVAPGAIVNVKSEQTGLSRMVQASEEGSYVIPFLPPGRYAMEVVAPGFQTFRQTGIAIDASQTARIDFTLQPGALEQSVTISADYVGRHQTSSKSSNRCPHSSRDLNRPVRVAVALDSPQPHRLRDRSLPSG